ncbi:MAG TPA: YciI family protein [Gemmatimonadaceae bacterium]
MQYLLLIYNNEQNWLGLSEADRASISTEYRTYTESIAKSGHYKGGNALQPTTTATTVRVRNGKRATTDGPFAESREHLGGYYLVDAKDLDEAISLAERIPGAKYGSIEVRPIMNMAMPATAGA